MKKIEHLINGKLNSNFVNETSSVFNPATGEEASQVVLGTEKCVQDAVNSAKNAYTSWSCLLYTSPSPRDCQ